MRAVCYLTKNVFITRIFSLIGCPQKQINKQTNLELSLSSFPRKIPASSTRSRKNIADKDIADKDNDKYCS